MPQSSTGNLLATIGVCWPGLVLVVLIFSAAFEPVRDHVSAMGIGMYLGLWLLTLVPGVVLVLIGERTRKA